MDYKAFTINALTNMHVGGGDDTFGVVDKLVQRDPVTKHPTIYSSSLKGALREYFNGTSFRDYIFGVEANGGETEPGHYRFFAANLLAIPVRSNVKPFFMATTPSVLKEFINTMKTFSVAIDGIEVFENLSKIGTQGGKALIHENLTAKIEDWDAVRNENIPASSPILGENIALLSEDDFKELTAQLPVIARNHLENGKSTNLWYEEIVPRESRFYFIVGYGEQYQAEFESKIQEGLVQIGGNASIGYGFTKITKIGG